MRTGFIILTLLILMGVSSSAQAAECNGQAMLVFMPAVPAQISISTNYGDVVIAVCNSGSAALHRCICINGQTLSGCKYLVTPQGTFGKTQSGGCKWRNIDGVCWCVDEGGCSNSGSVDDPIMVEPMQ